MKERPILFSGAMVRAILSGQKTQTRRVVKNPRDDGFFVMKDDGAGMWPYRSDDGECLHYTDKAGYDVEESISCPYGQPGDRLWVRETWNWFDPVEIPEHRRGSRAPFTGCQGSRKIPWVAAYSADGHLEHAHLGRALWRPSIHMPRWACRIVLEIVSVRVERLQGISLIDAEAEGIVKRRSDVYAGDVDYLPIQDGEPFRTPVEAYRALWESINGAESWLANPWVWVVEFRRVDK